jgi:glutamate/tyrosine decarboxylase-like PLP-dependent enzyme
LHAFDEETEKLAQRVVDYALWRVRLDPPPLDRPRAPVELAAEVGDVITPDGLGGEEALRRFTDLLAPATISSDHPGFLSFVPTAPTEASLLFDMVMGASSFYGGSWLEGAGVVFAENQALRWLSALAGMPPGSGGVFLSGGTAANLSALVAAREFAREMHGRAGRPVIVTGEGSHSSVTSAARVMDARVVTVPAGRAGRLTGGELARVLEDIGTERVVAVVATAGTTNAGIVDDLVGVSHVCDEHMIWMHVDGAYGLAAMASPTYRSRFNGIERSDSFVVDPHKWLFAPYDCAALVYRDPEDGRKAHTQYAAYLDPITTRREWNPSDYAFHLTRRARGLPFWFSLAVHGTEAYADAVDACMDLAHSTARRVEELDHLELLLEPELSIVLFRRKEWTLSDYQAWSDSLLASGRAFVVPTTYEGEPCLRLCFVNPRTTMDLVEEILDSLE